MDHLWKGPMQVSESERIQKSGFIKELEDIDERQ